MGIVLLGLAVGTAAGYVVNDRFGGEPANADNATLTSEVRSTGSTATTVVPIAARIDPVVERFAWDSTCAVALMGLGSPDSSTVVQSLGTARDQVALFEPGIVPAEVGAALEAGYQAVVVPGQRAIAADPAQALGALGTDISGVCASWDQRIAG